MKKILALLMSLSMVLGLAACGSKTSTTSSTSGVKSNGTSIGIAMPTKTLQRWVNDGNSMSKELKALGYTTDIQYADNDAQNQLSQIENMITKGAKVLIIAAVDATTLTSALEQAHKANIKIISYDRLLLNSAFVDYYATFDNFKVGVLQAEYIESNLGLKEGKGPFNIEIFAGSPDDNNAKFFFDGAMSILEPYITSGKLVVKSGQKSYAQVGILNWDGATAQSRMDNLLSKSYTSAKVDAILSPNDAISIGIISSLKGVGYGSKDEKMPIITGQDCEVASVKSIIAGDQTASIFKDTRVLSSKAAQMADRILKGKKIEVNDVKSYDTGFKVVPSFLCDSVVVDKNNYKEVLIDSGYYTENEIK